MLAHWLTLAHAYGQTEAHRWVLLAGSCVAAIPLTLALCKIDAYVTRKGW
jgi:hypothetical protein